MYKVLITGGSGTVGSSFIKTFLNEYEFYAIGRNDSNMNNLKAKFPGVKPYLCAIENKDLLMTIYDKIRPDIVIHAAAIKHIDFAENNVIHTLESNLIGSLNIIECSKLLKTPLTVAISTDKACEHSNIYGMSKYLMEKCFIESNSPTSKFSVCRFGNVANSSGSVIPFWLKAASENKPLKLTHADMNRLMFSKKEAAILIKECIDMSKDDGGFILSKKMKTVNMLDLAKRISSDVEIIGIRSGEKLNEDLISNNELEYTQICGDYIRINKNINPDTGTRLKYAYNTLSAESMLAEEIDVLISERTK